jgi:hypothetical protein
MVSGHWETATPAVNVMRGSNDTIYDFYGFPKSMYKVRPSLPPRSPTPRFGSIQMCPSLIWSVRIGPLFGKY